MEQYRFPKPDDIFQLYVTLMGVEPAIWRRLLVAQDVTLPRFHAILQDAMGWTNSHLHAFKVGDVEFAEPDPDFGHVQPISHRRIRLNQILNHPGSTCVYEYDFGDGWEHLIKLEQEVPADEVTTQVPCCLDGERACPPEDVGGTGGFADFLVALQDPGHPEHDQNRAWVGPHYDPEAFDPNDVNVLLSVYAGRRRSC